MCESVNTQQDKPEEKEEDDVKFSGLLLFIPQPKLWESKTISYVHWTKCESVASSPVVQLASHQSQRGKISTAVFILSTV